MPAVTQEQIEILRAFISQSSRIVVFTGAGISTESGISDFRSKGGIWERFQPVTIQEFLASEDNRREYWRRKREMYREMRDAEPNAGHRAIARLEKSGKLLGVITQNIDGLHQQAGNKQVIEIHGTNREVICLSCKQKGPSDAVYKRLDAGEDIPLCKDCGGFLKPNTISFGQELDPLVLRLAFEWANACDLMISVGSSLVVEPAASLPRVAKRSGARLVIINRDPTPLDSQADLVLHAKIGPLLNSVVN